MSQSPPLHEIWRRAYRQRRYCQHLSQSELNGRIRDLFLTLCTLTPDAKVGVLDMDIYGARCMELWTHVLEEMVIRFGPYPAGFTREILHSEPFPDFVGPLAARAAAALNHISQKGVTIKFGKPEHMRDLYERGALRIQSASFYRKADHNGAIRDDELALEVSLSLQREHIVKLVANPQDVPADVSNHRFDIRYESITDYWLYCVTTAVQPRIFVDFEAEACVVIKDTPRFLEALNKAVAPHVQKAQFRHGEICYIDPLQPATAIIDVPMSKHFSYSYQKEVRFAWIPSEPRSDLTHIDVELGSLKEYAELIMLPATPVSL